MIGARFQRPGSSLSTALLVAVLLGAPAAPAAADSDWIEESNRHTHWLLGRQALFNPEFAGQQGYDGVDEEIVELGPDRPERVIAANEETLAGLEKRHAAAEDTRVRQDLEIMIASVDRNLRGARLNRDRMIPYVNAPQVIFVGLSALLDPQIPAARRAAAGVRLRRYVGEASGYAPLTERAQALMESRFDVGGLVWPYRVQVERDLANAPRFVEGIRQLFDAMEIEGYAAELDALEAQVTAHGEWVREQILPRARDDFRLPEALYALSLEQFGVEASPDALIADATAAFADIRNEMIAMAELVAAERGWEDPDYRAVIRRLKEARFDDDNILAVYHATNEALEAIIRREDIVSLPPREVSIRMKTPAEEAALPAPSLQPPRLIGNTGEVVEFLLPSPGDGQDRADDFIFEATAWTLSAHELRPGHELQFSTMLENGVSDARATFAFNSVNVEGWALYAEAEIKPYLPLEGQLIGLQHRLLRAARAFLDPMLNTGRITVEEARRILTDEVVLSPHMAEMEIQRYTFQAPGQATSYFYGYKLLQGLRTRTEIVLGDAFNRREFHDFVLAQGLLPPRLIERAVVEEFIPSRTVLVGQNAL